MRSAAAGSIPAISQKWTRTDIFIIVDRIKDMIKTVGENVYPREVEEVLFMHPKVKDAVVVGIPQEFLGEEIKAYIVLKEGTTATAEEIIQFCREQLSKFKVPKEVEFRRATAEDPGRQSAAAGAPGRGAEENERP